MNANTAARTPSHWPSNIQYLTQQRYHSSVPCIVLLHLRPIEQPVKPSSHSFPSRPPVVIRQIVLDGHPAKGQYGLFASKKIPPRCFILDYIGEVHCDDRPDSDYDLSLYRPRDGPCVGVDASRMGNEARFINDYRGVAPRPNAQFEERRDATGELRMSVWSSSDAIKKGDEILVSYGKGFWQARTSTEMSLVPC